MKKALSIFLFLTLSLAAFGQSVSNSKSGDPFIDIKNAPRQTPDEFAYQPKDFNYTFYPASSYNRFATVHKTDTATQIDSIVPDSTVNQKLQVIVEKTGDVLTVRGVADPTAIYYRENIKFAGFTKDGTQTIVYMANTKDTEVVYVNPSLGYVVIGFKTCDSRYTKDCDLNYHYFGIVPPRKFMK